MGICNSVDMMNLLADAGIPLSKYTTSVVIEARVESPPTITVESFVGPDEAGTLKRVIEKYELVKRDQRDHPDQPDLRTREDM